MTIQSNGHEHELEPQYGLPERLPATEKILWQGSPDARALARSAFHLRKLALYFAALMALQAANVAADGASVADVLLALVWPAGLSALALLGVWTLAWLTARTAVYTVTDRRVVMRIGIVLTLTFNLPLRTIESAAMRQGSGGHGDIVLALKGPDHIAWLHLWPHARPWHLTRTQPMLRALPQVADVAALLQRAWSAQTGGAVEALATPASNPPSEASQQGLQPSMG
ncbi:MAG: photosynthetic complex putative assembly protein PuhB [Betaproteobacteria bacterium]|jgi:hypothetical protein|nr:PH domain-containing protein [Rubrivivax sp.]